MIDVYTITSRAMNFVIATSIQLDKLERFPGRPIVAFGAMPFTDSVF